MQFPHRVNIDGTIDSICQRCFATVGSAMVESDLASMEAAHICEPARIEYYQHIELTGKRPPSPDSDELLGDAQVVNRRR
jgi:hypothetical protein